MPLTIDPQTAVLMLFLGLLVFVLARLRRFAYQWVGYLLDWLFWTLSRFLQRTLSSRLSLKRYCRLALNSQASRYLDVPGAHDATLETDRAFVPLLLDEGRGDVTYSHATLFDAGSRLRVIGDPGSGKSSLIKKLYRDACRVALDSPKTALLPIRVELKSFIPPDSLAEDAALLEWGLHQLRTRVVSSTAFDMDECYESYCHDGGVLVLLDGLDEVPGTAYDRTARLVALLSERLEAWSDRTRIVLTMRTQMHRQVKGDFLSTFPRVLHIRAFSPNDIFLFLKQWPFSSGRAEREVNRIYSDLTDRPTLREMCTNPLVLAMYVASDQGADSTAAMPETRTSFYSQVVTELLIARRGRQVGVTSARTALQREREAILGRLSLEHLLNPTEPANSLSWSAAVAIASEVRGTHDSAATEQYLRDLSKETGLFTEERDSESLRFIHLTFCEFLAALEAAEGQPDGWTDLLTAQRAFAADAEGKLRTRLLEVIPFTAGLLPRSRLGTGLVDVTNLGEPQVLARCFLETQAYDHPSWTSFVETEAAVLLQRSQSEWDEEWLAQLHLFSVVLREGERWGLLASSAPAPLTTEVFFQQLVGSDRDRLVRIFSSYAAQDPAASFRLAEACGIDLTEARPDLLVDACADTPFLALALERARSAGEAATEWSLVFAEAGLRFQVAAVTLSDTQSSSNSHAGRLPHERWAPPFRRGQTFYGQCLTVACASERAKTTTVFPLVRLLASVPPPHTLLRDGAVLTIAFLFVIALFTTMATMLVLAESVPSLLLAMVVGTLLYALMFNILMYPVIRRRTYDDLINAPVLRESQSDSQSPADTGSVSAFSDRLLPFHRKLLRQQRVTLDLVKQLRNALGVSTSEELFYTFDDGRATEADLLLTRSDRRLEAGFCLSPRQVWVETFVDQE